MRYARVRNAAILLGAGLGGLLDGMVPHAIARWLHGEGVVNHHLVALHHVRDLPPHVVFYDCKKGVRGIFL